MAEDNGVDVSAQIKELEGRAAQVGAVWTGCPGVSGMHAQGLPRARQYMCQICTVLRMALSRAGFAALSSWKVSEICICSSRAMHARLQRRNIAPDFACTTTSAFTHENGPFPFVAQLRTDTYSRLTPVQQLSVARHPNRPTFLDIALNITDKFVELHGDRAGLDDPAMVRRLLLCPCVCSPFTSIQSLLEDAMWAVEAIMQNAEGQHQCSAWSPKTAADRCSFAA